MLRCAALIVEGNHPLSRAAQVGDDEAYGRIELAWVPFDLGDERFARVWGMAAQDVNPLVPFYPLPLGA